MIVPTNYPRRSIGALSDGVHLCREEMLNASLRPRCTARRFRPFFHPMFRKILYTLLKLLVASAAVYWLQKVDAQNVLRVLRDADPVFFGGAFFSDC